MWKESCIPLCYPYFSTSETFGTESASYPGCSLLSKRSQSSARSVLTQSVLAWHTIRYKIYSFFIANPCFVRWHKIFHSVDGEPVCLMDSRWIPNSNLGQNSFGTQIDQTTPMGFNHTHRPSPLKCINICVPFMTGKSFVCPSTKRCP